MKWIKAKMRELGVESNPNYKITFYMDSLAMITVHTQKYGVVQVNLLPHFVIITQLCSETQHSGGYVTSCI